MSIRELRRQTSIGRRLAALDPGLLVALMLPLLAIIPLLTHTGLPNTADGPAHLMRQVELNQAWQAGILFPRWAPHLAYGYGAPIFSYAPPLLYGLTQSLHLTGLALDAAMKGTVLLMLVVYSLGAYLLVHELFGAPAGIVAAAAYVYTPYRLRETYVQGNYGQLCGLALYPLILWAFLRLAATRQLRYMLAASLFLALLLLSHNISVMLFLPLLAVYLLLLCRVAAREKQSPAAGGWSLPLLFAAAVGVGLGLSAFFWLPAFVERDFIRLAGITQGFFDFRHNFITLTELLALPRPLDLASINPYFPLTFGVAQVLLALLSLVTLPLLILKRRARKMSSLTSGTYSLSILFAAAFLGYGFLALPQSTLIWEHVPMLELAEFPWRMLGPALLCASVLAGGATYAIQQLGGTRRARTLPVMLVTVGLLLVIGTNLVYLFPDQFIPWGTPDPLDVMAYEVETGAIGTTSTGEFLPAWTDSFPSPQVFARPLLQARAAGEAEPDIPYVEPDTLPAGARVATISRSANSLILLVETPAPFAAHFRLLYWPGWRVFLSPETDTRQAQISTPVDQVAASVPDGLVMAPLPAGQYLVRLRLTPTPVRLGASVLSAISGLAVIVLLVAAALKQRCRKPPVQPVVAARFSWRTAALMTAVLLLTAVLIQSLAPLFSRRSLPGQVLGARQSIGAEFDRRIELLAFDAPTRPLLAGQQLTAVLYWQATTPLDDNYRVFLHLDGPDGRTYASADELNPADIPTANWPPGLYVRNPLTLDLPAALPAVRYTLTAGLYDHHTGVRLPVTACAGCTMPVASDANALPLTHIWLLPASPLTTGDIARPLRCHFGQNIDLLGYDLSDPRADGHTQFTLYWRAGAALDRDYTVFVHVVDANGTVVGQFDAPPQSGLYPTSAWLPHQIVADQRTLQLPSGATGLRVGLYEPATLARLHVTDADGRPLPDDALLIQVSDEE